MSTTTAKLPPMTADEFIAWAMRQPESVRYELSNGHIVAMSPERWGHAIIKTRIANLMANAIRDTGLRCDVVADGLSVQIDESSVFEPDVLLRCGTPLDFDVLVVTDPLVVVEVLSPSTSMRDRTVKLAGYFRVATVQHYLLVSIDERRVVHHRRITDTEFATRICGSEPILLDPPGITLVGLFD